ncbi:hypothetical protein E2C01_089624 [Portunus trituberculatus]|uniref:Uncharacterized protein n=1 Tax=Portunus trituberculatus TaxID=210409 RepID=A0A5B7JJA6_PORTR|nr:hypothetical protein [Portunus trituberculatus]
MFWHRLFAFGTCATPYFVLDQLLVRRCVLERMQPGEALTWATEEQMWVWAKVWPLLETPAKVMRGVMVLWIITTTTTTTTNNNNNNNN